LSGRRRREHSAGYGQGRTRRVGTVCCPDRTVNRHMPPGIHSTAMRFRTSASPLRAPPCLRQPPAAPSLRAHRKHQAMSVFALSPRRIGKLARSGGREERHSDMPGFCTKDSRNASMHQGQPPTFYPKCRQGHRDSIQPFKSASPSLAVAQIIPLQPITSSFPCSPASLSPGWT